MAPLTPKHVTLLKCDFLSHTFTSSFQRKLKFFLGFLKNTGFYGRTLSKNKCVLEHPRTLLAMLSVREYSGTTFIY